MGLGRKHGSGTNARGNTICSVSIALASLAAIPVVTSAMSAHASASQTQPTSEVAVLSRPHALFSPQGKPLGKGDAIAANRPITGVPTALPVVGRTVTPDGVQLLHVLLPGRPNGRQGWIVQGGTTLTKTSWRIVVRTTSRRVLVYNHGRLERIFTAIVGKPSTPTPHGTFFVEESVRMPRGSTGGPYALALSAHSDALQNFEGGAGQIAIHGVANLTGTLGTASSHGCIRLDDRTIRWMAAHIAPGVRVRITR